MKAITKLASTLEILFKSIGLFIFKGHSGLMEYKQELDIKLVKVRREYQVRKQIMERTYRLTVELKTLMSFLEQAKESHYIKHYSLLSKLVREIHFLKEELMDASHRRT